MAVELDVDNADGRLTPGTFCQVRWPVRRAGPSLFVSTASVASTTDRTFVVRVRGGKAEWVDVTTGLTVGPLIEVFGNLTPGDEATTAKARSPARRRLPLVVVHAANRLIEAIDITRSPVGC